jgi:hypothetical protein
MLLCFLTVFALTFGQVASSGVFLQHEYILCTDNDILGVQSLDIDANSMMLTISVDAVPTQDISAGIVHATVSRIVLGREVVVVDNTYNLCKMVTCPLMSNQNTSFATSVKTNILLMGSYNVKLVTADPVGNTLSCLKFTLDIP